MMIWILIPVPSEERALALGLEDELSLISARYISNGFNDGDGYESEVDMLMV